MISFLELNKIGNRDEQCVGEWQTSGPAEPDPYRLYKALSSVTKQRESLLVDFVLELDKQNLECPSFLDRLDFQGGSVRADATSTSTSFVLSHISAIVGRMRDPGPDLKRWGLSDEHVKHSKLSMLAKIGTYLNDTGGAASDAETRSRHLSAAILVDRLLATHVSR